MSDFRLVDPVVFLVAPVLFKPIKITLGEMETSHGCFLDNVRIFESKLKVNETSFHFHDHIEKKIGEIINLNLSLQWTLSYNFH